MSLIGSILQFRIWSPKTWPSLNKLLVQLPLLLIFYLNQKYLLKILFRNKLDEQTFELLINYGLVFVLTNLLIKITSIYRHRREQLKLFDKCNIPSVPNKNFFSGNLFEVIVPDNNLLIIDEYHKKIGKSFGIFFGPDPWVFTTDLDLLQKLFVTEGNKYVDITQLRIPLMTEISSSLAQVQGEHWRRIRRALNPSFTLKQMKSDNVFEDVNLACEKILDSIAKHPTVKTTNADSFETSARIVDVLLSMKKFSVEVIFRVAYGRDNRVNMDPNGKEPLIDTMHVASKMVRGPVVWASIMSDGWQRILGFLGKFTPLGTLIGQIHATLDETLSERRKIAGKIGRDDRKMIDTVIESVDSNRMNDEELKANLFFIFIAGFETSANTAACLLWLLARDQRVQEKLRSSLVTEGDKSKYLEWCIHETLRLYPAVPTAVGRVVVDPFEMKGMTFGHGMTVIASTYSIHRTAEYWGDDFEDFRPERFEKPFKQSVQFFAFGHGPRVCIGSNLAMAELRLIISRLLLKYRVECCDSTPKDLVFSSPNLIHMIIDGSIDLRFIELTSL